MSWVCVLGALAAWSGGMAVAPAWAAAQVSDEVSDGVSDEEALLDEYLAKDEPTPGHPIVTIDPRVDAHHVAGELPCPNNPPAPEGWRYWSASVTPVQTEFAIEILQDSETYPMGAFIRAIVQGKLLAARVEWHVLQAATGRRGCFRGVNLMSPAG